MIEELKNLRVASYCRKSQEDEDKQMLSIPAQIEESKKVAKRYSMPDEFPIYQEAKSARFPGKRAMYLQLIKDIRSGKINALFCWKLDRLARNMLETGIRTV